jgi:2-polyprenyl-3-methyl-5-hydroxy-6-metoxy-1,4-benzoquinol methylase
MRFDDLEENYSPHLPADRSTKVLDVGCGQGRVLAFLKAKGFTQIKGVDRDVAAVQAARDATGCDVKLIDDLARDLAGRRHSFGLMIAKDVMYYVPRHEVVTILSLMREALVPGGRLLIEVINGASFTGPYTCHKDPFIEWVPTEHGVLALMLAAGFTNVRLVAHRAPRTSMKRLVFGAAQAAWRAALRTAYFVERGIDARNPSILTTKLLAITDVPAT